jgi:hypothetical protein
MATETTTAANEVGDQRLLRCICGTTPELIFQPAIEYRGHGFQTASIDCTVCLREVAITFESPEDDAAYIMKTLDRMWNDYISNLKPNGLDQPRVTTQ